MTTETTTLPLATGTWKADVAHSSVAFVVRHLGISKVRGRFDGFTTDLVVGESLGTSSVNAVVDMSTVSTGNSDRDAHLATSDFFNVDNHPTMAFSSTSITDAGGGEYTMQGDLTINGITKPVEFAVEFLGTEVFPMDQTTHAGFGATGSISRKDFGIEFNAPLGGDKVMISDKVQIELDIQLVAG